MGTSQSFKLSTQPNWSAAKSAMTAVSKSEGDAKAQCANFISHFAKAVNYGYSNSRGSRSNSSNFGRAGSRIASNFVSFIGNVRANSLQTILEQINPQIDYEHLPASDILILLYNAIIGDDGANMDDEAAKSAMQTLIFEMLGECQTPGDIDIMLKNANNEQIENWLIKFEVNYIVEYNEQVFQEQIYKHASDSRKVCKNIKNYLKGVLQEKLSEEMHHINFFNEDGARYVKNLTENILNIWKPKSK